MLRQAIAEGRIVPGQRLFQDLIAKELGVSTTPVREALRQLAAEGVLRYDARGGVTLAQVGPEDVEEIYTIRAALESLAVRKGFARLTVAHRARLQRLAEEMERQVEAGTPEAMRRVTMLNDQFHLLLESLPQMPRLVEIVAGLRQRYPIDLFVRIPGRARKTCEEHRRILAAVEAGDAAAAASAMEDHVHSVMRDVIDYLLAAGTGMAEAGGR